MPKSAPRPAAASSSLTFSSSFFSSFFFSSFFSPAAGAGAAGPGGTIAAVLRASSMFTPSRAAVSAFTRVASTFTPAAERTFMRFSSFTGFPAACSPRAPPPAPPLPPPAPPPAGGGPGGGPPAGPPPRGERERLGLRLREQEPDARLRREAGLHRERDRPPVGGGEGGPDRLRGRVPDEHREVQAMGAREREVRPDPRVVDREDVPPEHGPGVVRAPEVEPDRERVDLEAREGLRDLPWDPVPRLHEELVLLDHDLPALDRRGDAVIKKIADTRPGLERRVPLADPQVLGGPPPAARGGLRLRRLHLLVQAERVDARGDDRGLALDGLRQRVEALPLRGCLLERDPQEVVLRDREPPAPVELPPHRLELGRGDAVDVHDPDHRGALELPHEGLHRLRLVGCDVGHGIPHRYLTAGPIVVFTKADCTLNRPRSSFPRTRRIRKSRFSARSSGGMSRVRS